MLIDISYSALKRCQHDHNQVSLRQDQQNEAQNDDAAIGHFQFVSESSSKADGSHTNDAEEVEQP